MTKKEIKDFISKMPDKTPYYLFKSMLAAELFPIINTKDFYHKWYGVFCDIKRGKM